MQVMPRIVPVSELRNHHKQVFAMAATEPVILAQHSKPAVVLVSITQWDQMARRMAELEEYMMTQSRLREMTADNVMTQEQFDRQLVEAGL